MYSFLKAFLVLIKQKIICSFEAFCDLYDTFYCYSNEFHLLLKKAETSYDNTSYKSN